MRVGMDDELDWAAGPRTDVPHFRECVLSDAEEGEGLASQERSPSPLSLSLSLGREDEGRGGALALPVPVKVCCVARHCVSSFLGRLRCGAAAMNQH